MDDELLNELIYLNDNIPDDVFGTPSRGKG